MTQNDIINLFKRNNNKWCGSKEIATILGKKDKRSTRCLRKLVQYKFLEQKQVQNGLIHMYYYRLINGRVTK